MHFSRPGSPHHRDQSARGCTSHDGIIHHVSNDALGRLRLRGVCIDDEMATDTNITHAVEPERVQGVGHRLTLRVEQPAPGDDVNGDAISTHVPRSSCLGLVGGGLLRSPPR